jgi:zinc transporter 1
METEPLKADIAIDIPRETVESKMSRKHEITQEQIDNSNQKKKKELKVHILKFIAVLLLNGSYFFVELIWGIKIGSLGLITDAVHMLSDVIAIIIGIYAAIAVQRENTFGKTYGYKRAEVVGGYVNSIMLVTLSFTLIVSAIEKLASGNYEGKLDENSTSLIIVAATGLGVNLISLILFGHEHEHEHDHEHEHNHNNSRDDGNKENKENKENNNKSNKEKNLNIKAVILHLAGDALSSLFVVVSGIIIKYSSSPYRFLADPLASLIISLLIIVSAYPIITKSTKILLQHVPDKINIKELREKILNIEHVDTIHELHVWQLDSDKIIGSCHVNIDSEINGINFMEICDKIKLEMHAIGIHSTTVQPEYTLLNKDGDKCHEPLCEIQCQEKHCC